ncbi:MAG: hypothetical protein P8Y36_04220, partial [Alphaproteobacteria bacterium]
ACNHNHKLRCATFACEIIGRFEGIWFPGGFLRLWSQGASPSPGALRRCSLSPSREWRQGATEAGAEKARAEMSGKGMSRRDMWRFPVFAILALAGSLLAACHGPSEVDYFRIGIGTELNWSGLAEATKRQEEYIGFICNQAGLSPSVSRGIPYCNNAHFSSREWGIFVQAGMNDIDRRCDAYIAWLDNKRRSSEPLLKQLSDTSTAVGSIMRVAGSGADAITIAGIAFGLAADTFTNVNSRLIYDIDHSTVQTIVFNRRNEYRENILKTTIDNRPAAVHALRSYLSLCMPYTIETDINTTITAFELGRRQPFKPMPLVTVATVGPPKARSPINTRRVSYSRREVSNRMKLEARKAICIPDSDIYRSTNKTKMLINIFETTYHENKNNPHIDGEIDVSESTFLKRYNACNTELYRNFYERTLNKAEIKALIALLTKTPQGTQLSEQATLTDPQSRQVIEDVKNADNKFQSEPNELHDQVTEPFIEFLETKR